MRDEFGVLVSNPLNNSHKNKYNSSNIRMNYCICFFYIVGSLQLYLFFGIKKYAFIIFLLLLWGLPTV